MITKFSERIVAEEAAGERKKLRLDKLLAEGVAPESLRTYAHAELDPDAEVSYHVHTGECECYYILSGKGDYNDNGEIVPVEAGDVTFTPSGHGHGLKNTGTDTLEFMALIIREK